MPDIINAGFSPVRRRNPIGLNTSSMIQSIYKLGDLYQKSTQQQSAIDVALAQLPVNAAEDEWRTNLSDEIRSQIEATDNPADRLMVATKLAGSTLNRPDVIGRIRANAEYENFVKQTQARTDIGQDVKDWALENNQYFYEDKKDASGRIVGGSQWKPNTTPVSTVPLSALIEEARKWVNADAGGGVTDLKVVGADGKLTNDLDKGAWGLAYQKDGRWETLSPEKLQQAINAAIETTPGAKASLQQDYNVAKWKYNKLTPDEKKNFIGTDITDDKGFLLNEQDYLAKKIAPAIAAMQYNRQYTDIKIGDGIKNYYTATGGGGSTSETSTGIVDPLGMRNLQTLATPVTVDINKQMSSAYGDLSSNIDSLSKLYPNLSQTPEWKRLVNNGDYDGLYDLAKRNMTSKDVNIRTNANRLLAQIKDQGQLFNDYLSGLNKKDKDAVRFALAIQSGSELPSDNEYTKDYVEAANSIMDGADSAAFVVQNEDQLNRILERMECKNINELKTRYGLDIVTHDGRTGIKFKNNSRGLPALAEAIANDSDEFWSLSNSHLITYNADGSVKDDKSHGQFGLTKGRVLSSIYQRATGTSGATTYFNRLAQTRNVIDWFRTHAAANAVERRNELMEGRGQLTDTRTVSTLGTKSFQLADLQAQLNAGIIDQSDYNSRQKELEKAANDQIRLHNYSQTPMYLVQGGGAGAITLDAKEREEIGNIISAMKDNELLYNVGDNGYEAGVFIKIPPQYDNKDKRKVVNEAIEVFVPHLMDEESYNAYVGDTDFRARKRFNQASFFGGSIKLNYGSAITNITENGGIRDGKYIHPSQIRELVSADMAVEDAKRSRDAGTLRETTAQAVAMKYASAQGYTPTSQAYLTCVKKIYNEIVNGE